MDGFDKSDYVTVYVYKSKDGTKYDASSSTNSTAYFILSPDESKKFYIYCSEDELKIDYSQIAQVYLLIDGEAVELALNVA